MKSVSIYVPMGLEKSEEWLLRTQRVMVRVFGGATTTLATGQWLNAYNVIVHDTIAVVKSYEMKEGVFKEYGMHLTAHCDDVKRHLEQDCVLMTVDEGSAILV